MASMSAACRNHGDEPATHAATMPSAVRPYKEAVPLCSACAERIEAIGGFPVEAIAPHNDRTAAASNRAA